MIKTIEDLKKYSENELSLLVFNTEYLYKSIDNQDVLLSKLDNKYIYSKKQLSILLEDINYTLLERIKELTLEDIREVKWRKNGTLHIMSYQTVYEHMLIANDKEQKQIKDMIVHIDFMNGDILDYFKHLGKCLTN